MPSTRTIGVSTGRPGRCSAVRAAPPAGAHRRAEHVRPRLEDLLGRHGTRCAPVGSVRSVAQTTSPSGLPTRIVSVRSASIRTRAGPVRVNRINALSRRPRRLG